MASPQPLTHLTAKGPSREFASDRRTTLASAASDRTRSTFRDIVCTSNVPMYVRKDAPKCLLLRLLPYRGAEGSRTASQMTRADSRAAQRTDPRSAVHHVGRRSEERRGGQEDACRC